MALSPGRRPFEESMRSKQCVVVLATVAFMFTVGCTRSLEVKYQPGFAAGAVAKPAAKERVAIVDLTDVRSWVDKSDEASKTFFAKGGPWKFGLTVNGNDFTPIATVVQTLFVEDFKAAGYDAFAAKAITPGVYSISGKVMVFEFENETGVFTVTSRRSVSLALTITGKDGTKLVEDSLFTENDREGEGMGVLHSTNVDKLLHGPFKKVVAQVVTKLQSKLVAAGPTEIHVSVNGVPVQGDWTPASTRLVASR
jgi:hypothetical protein